MPLVWKSLEGQGLSATTNIITQSQRQWKEEIDLIHPFVSDRVNFLSCVCESGVGYSAITTACCALDHPYLDTEISGRYLLCLNYWKTGILVKLCSKNCP